MDRLHGRIQWTHGSRSRMSLLRVTSSPVVKCCSMILFATTLLATVLLVGQLRQATIKTDYPSERAKATVMGQYACGRYDNMRRPIKPPSPVSRERLLSHTCRNYMTYD